MYFKRKYLNMSLDPQNYKYVGIILLTIQQASMPLMARAARYREEKEVFITTVNVFIMEIIKLIVCSTILLANYKSLFKFLERCYEIIVLDYKETAKICIPSLIYTVQNNLYYIALTNLESTTFCVAYQMKILVTAIFLKFFLSKEISQYQWIALILLIIGVTDVQLQYEPPTKSNVEQNPTLGFAAVLTMCFTSAFAGVYMEKVLKQSDVNIWMQNIRLALLGFFISAFSMWYKDFHNIQQYGFFRGFDSIVWIMTITNSAGGLLISVVIKYADNILKAYAQSTAIIGAAVGSWILFDFRPNFMFVLGTMIVIVSICLYTKNPPSPKPQKPQIIVNGIIKPTYVKIMS
uniref:Uncharacterized protein n=1 Tax=Acrobeloides nanus TaxID=290746 RepID=A0A914EJ78_9BILA